MVLAAAVTTVFGAAAGAFAAGLVAGLLLWRLRTRRLLRQLADARSNAVALAAERHALIAERARHDARAEAARAETASVSAELVEVRSALSGCERGLDARQEQIDALTEATAAQHRRLVDLQHRVGPATPSTRT